MATEIAELEMRVGSTGVDRARRSLRDLNREGVQGASRATRAYNTWKTSVLSLRGAVTGLAGALVVRQFIRFLDTTISEIDAMDKLSTRLGISTEALSEYQLVLDRSGVSTQTFNLGLQRMTRRVAEAAQGTGEAKNALAELGIEAVSFSKLAPDKQFEIIADAIAGVGTQADRVRLAMKLFDSEGVALIQTMEGGSKAIREVREEARRMGLTVSQDMVDAAVAAKDAMADLNAVMTGLRRAALIPLVQNIVDLANALGLIKTSPAMRIRAIGDELEKMQNNLKRLRELQAAPIRGTILGFLGADLEAQIKKRVEDIKTAEESLKRLEEERRKRNAPKAGTVAPAGGTETKVTEDSAKDLLKIRLALGRELTKLEDQLSRSMLNESERRIAQITDEQAKRLALVQRGISELGIPVAEASELREQIEESSRERIIDVIADSGQEIRDLQRSLDEDLMTALQRRTAGIRDEEQKRLGIVETHLDEGLIMEERAAELREQIEESTRERIINVIADSGQEVRDLQRSLDEDLMTAAQRRTAGIRDEEQKRLEIVETHLDEGVIMEERAAELRAQIHKAANEQIKDSQQETTDFMQDLSRRAAENMQDAFGEFFFDVFKGRLDSVENIFDSFTDNILRSFSQMLAKMAAEQILGPGGFNKGAGGLFGGGGLLGRGISALGGLLGIPATVAHRGGRIGEISDTRMVSAATFNQAPRFRNGGIAGLGPDEVPAILHRGEEVTPAEDVATRNRRLGPAITINFNVTSPDVRGFQQSEGQIAAQLARMIDRARRNL